MNCVQEAMAYHLHDLRDLYHFTVSDLSGRFLTLIYFKLLTYMFTPLGSLHFGEISLTSNFIQPFYVQ